MSPLFSHAKPSDGNSWCHKNKFSFIPSCTSVNHHKCGREVVKFYKNNTKKIEWNHCHFVEREASLMTTTAHFWFEELFKAETFFLKWKILYVLFAFNGNEFSSLNWRRCWSADTKNAIHHQSLSRSMP